MAQDYNATLNLPKTEFPMRAGLPKREPDWLKAWEERTCTAACRSGGEGSPASSSMTALPSPTAISIWAPP